MSGNVNLSGKEIYRPQFLTLREYRVAFLLTDISRIQDVVATTHVRQPSPNATSLFKLARWIFAK